MREWQPVWERVRPLLEVAQANGSLPRPGRDGWIGAIRSPLREDNSPSMTVLPDGPASPGAWTDKGTGEFGSMRDLARRLNVEMPELNGRANIEIGPERTLAEFCRRRRILPETLERFRVREVAHQGRPALRWPTPVGIDRVKFLDGRKPKNKWAKTGGELHLYGRGTARAGGPLYLVNGEPSVWACAQEGQAAVCVAGGEGSLPSPPMLQELRETGCSEIRIVYDRDERGVNGARKALAALRAAGLAARALELPPYLGETGDVDDLHVWHGAEIGGALAALPELGDGPPEMEWRQDGEEFAFTFWSELAAVDVARIRESSEGTHAELTAWPLEPTGERGRQLCAPTRINLLTSTGRSVVAKMLDREASGAVEWSRVVERVATTVITELRRPDPVVRLADIEPDLGPTRMLVRPWAPAGDPTVFYGPGGSLKSYLMLSLAVAVTHYLPLPGGIEPVDACAVLYLDFEATAKRTRNRLEYVSRSFGLDAVPQDIHYRRVRGTLHDNLATLRRDVSQLGIGLVIVDSISRACGELEASTAVNQFWDALAWLDPAIDQPVTKFVLSHVRKGDLNEKRSTPFGSIMTVNAARATWEMRTVKDERAGFTDLVVLQGKENDLGYVAPLDLRARFGDGVFTGWEQSGDNAAIVEHASATQKLIRALLHAPTGALSTSELAAETEEKDNSVRAVLSRHEGKLFTRVERGQGPGSESRWALRETHYGE